MARQNLTSLLNTATAKAPEATVTQIAPPAPPAVERPEAGERINAPAPRPKAAEKAAKAGRTGVRYYELERKETRLRSQQVEDLNAFARRLSKKREAGSGERITENTLIRIAVDLLLERKGDLAGDNEAELRKSVGL